MLDTHIAIWLVSNESWLTEAELALLARASTQVYCSTVSLWELRLKWRKLGLSARGLGLVDPAEVLDLAMKADWQIVPVRTAHVFARLDPPAPNKDPFDEMLLMQAQEEGLRLLTRDAKLIDHPLAAPLH